MKYVKRGILTSPHDFGVFDLVDYAFEVIAEHACAHWLAAAFEIGHYAGYYGVEGAEERYEDVGALGGTQSRHGSAKNNLR
jgi:hypothetical protein